MSAPARSGPLPARQESRTLNIKKTKAKDQGFKRWPRNCINQKIHEKDSMFFEMFDDLSRAQLEVFQCNASTLAGDLKPDLPLPSDAQLGLSDCYQPLSGSQLELLYVEALYTIKHKIGATSGGFTSEVKDLYDYVQKAFHVSQADHDRLLAKANDEKPPVVVLDITVLEAKDLEAKDADGFSDPYCMLGIVPAKLDQNPVKAEPQINAVKDGMTNRASQKRKTPLEHIPARYIKTTTVRDNTLNPVWNEKFRLDVQDPTSEHLHLDIWDHDDDSSVMDSARKLNEVKGLRGLGRYFKQIAQSARTGQDQTLDDFLGCMDIQIKDIPSTGLDQWYDLKGRTAKSSVQGSVHLNLRLATYEDRGLDVEEGLYEMREHRDLMSVFIRHECNIAKKNEDRGLNVEEGLYEMRKHKDFMFILIRHENNTAKSSGEVWAGDLSKAARTILHQHAIQGDLTDLQLAACNWMALVQQFCHKPFDWSLLFNSLDEIDFRWKSSQLYREEEEALSRAFDFFQQYCMAVISRQRQLITLSDQSSHERLQSMLACLNKMQSSEYFRRCCPFSKELKYDVILTVKKSVSDRYKWLQDKRRSGDTCEDGLLPGYALMVNRLIKDCLIALHLYTPAYNSLKEFCYFQTYFKHAHRLLSADLEEDLKSFMSLGPAHTDGRAVNFRLESFSAKPVLQLYLALAQFHSLVMFLPTGCDRSNIGSLDVNKVFHPYLVHWTHLLKVAAENRVTMATNLDQIEVVDESMQQSTSPIDIAFTFGQISEFWLSLRWSEVGNPVELISDITKIICDAALLYADLTHDKLKAVGYYDEIGQFDVTQQLCITINNIEQVRTALAPLPDYLRYEEEIRSAAPPEEVHSILAALYEQVSTADAQMVDKIKLVVDRVADRMRPDIKKFVSRLCWAPEKAQSIDMIDKLMNYLDSNLTTLSVNMMKRNFERILDSIWIELLEEINEVISNKDQDFRNAHWISSRLSESLEILVDFFHAEEKGLPLAAIHCPLYEEIYKQLKLNQMPVEELMEEFFQNKIQLQENTSGSKYGTISVRAYYKPEVSVLMVEVVNAKDLLPLDKNGLSDPFVMVQLRPEHLFPQNSSVQTKVVSKCLNPQFNDSFEFEITEDQCLGRAACVVFTVMDHDVITANDFAGEAYLPLASVHGVAKRKKTSHAALTPQTLSLMNPHSGDEPSAMAILSALSLRDDHKGPADFIKRRKSLYNSEAD